MVLPYSDAVFCCAFSKECTETFQEGHVRSFAYFGGVRKRISYDNLKIAVAEIVGPRGDQLTEEFSRLKSHFLFAPHFCRVRRPNEKGHVEGMVGLYPAELSRAGSLGRILGGVERRTGGAVPAGPDPAIAGEIGDQRPAPQGGNVPHCCPFRPGPSSLVETTPVRSNSLSLVRFDRNDYSVPTAYAHRELIAVGGH